MKEGKNNANDFDIDSEMDELNATFDSLDRGAQNRLTKYQGEFNRPNIKFKGMPRDYYPTTCLSLT